MTIRFIHCLATFDNKVHPLFSAGVHAFLTFLTTNPKSRKRIVSKEFLRKGVVWANDGTRDYKFYSIDEYEKVREEFIKNIINSYNNITREEFQIKIPDIDKE